MVQESHNGEVIEGSAESRSGAPSGPSANFRRYALWGTIVVVLVFGVFGVWAATAPLSGAVVAPGQIAVDSSTKTIQHLRGGIVRRIAVEEGEAVDEGDVLVELDSNQARAELQQARASYITSLAATARLEAELQARDNIVFPKVLQEESAGQIDLESVRATQRSIFTTRREALESELAELDERIQTLRARINGAQGVVASLNEQIASYAEEIDEWGDLYEQELASKQDLRKAERRKLELQGELASREAEIAKLQSQIQSTRVQRELRQREYRREVAGQLGEARRRSLEAGARIPALEQRLARTSITAPVAGQVVDLRVHTLGGVVDRGQALMKIVPTSEELVIRARVQPADIDSVRTGQQASLRFPALNTPLVEDIKGTVRSVSADTIADENKDTQYYLAQVVVSEDGTRKLREAGLDLQSGMPVTAMIQTEGRTLLAYLLDPITEMMAQSMREP